MNHFRHCFASLSFALVAAACVGDDPEEDAPEMEPSAQAADAVEDACVQSCSDAHEVRVKACVRDGYSSAAASCVGPRSKSKPKWCAGTRELCGLSPSEACLNTYFPPISQGCEAANAPAADAFAAWPGGSFALSKTRRQNPNRQWSSTPSLAQCHQENSAGAEWGGGGRICHRPANPYYVAAGSNRFRSRVAQHHFDRERGAVRRRVRQHESLR